MGIIDKFLEKRVEKAVRAQMATQSHLQTIIRDLIVHRGFVNSPYSSAFPIEKGYDGNATVYTVVSRIAAKCSTIPLLLKRKLRSGEEEEITTHPVLDLLNRPNKTQSKQEYIEQLIGCLLLTGAGISWKIKLDSGKIQELHILPTNHISLETVYGKGLCEIIKYLMNWGEQVEYLPGEIIHVKFPDYNWKVDGSHLLGCSPLRAGRTTVNRASDAETSSMKQLQNEGAKGAFTPKSDSITMDEPQADYLREKLDESVNGSKNRAKVAIAQIPMDYHQMGMSAEDQEILATEKYTDEKICRIYGFPYVLISTERATENNYVTATRDLISNTCMNILTKLCNELKRSLLSEYNDLKDAYFVPDITGLPEMQKDIKDLVLAAKDAWWLTINERRAMMNYEEDAVNGSRVLVPSTLADIEEIGLSDAQMEADNQIDDNQDE